MKKFLLAVLLLASSTCFAQESPQNQSFGKKILSRLEFGIKAGANASNFNKFNIPTDPLIGFHAGASVAYKFNDHLMVQEDFLYSMQGAKLKGGVLGTQDLKLSYVQVPILVKYRTTSGFYVEAGAQTGILIKEDVVGLDTDQKFAKKIDASAVGGIGFQSKMGLGIGARYSYGFTKVSDTPSAVLGDFTNNNIQASLFYTF